jgi:hypothetical protein
MTTSAELLIDRICAERQKVNGTPPNLTRARLSLKVGVDLTDPSEFTTDTQLEFKIRNAAAALGIVV